MRKPIDKTYTISIDHYALLFNCCNQYIDNLAWKYPEQCGDGEGCCGLDKEMFYRYLKFEIPSLFCDNNIPAVPTIHRNIFDPDEEETDEYDQYALLDYIEFFAQNCKDYERGRFHSYYGHYHFTFSETCEVFDRFRNDINQVFSMTGLLYTLTEAKIIERVIDESVVSPELVKEITKVKEPGIRDLLTEAIIRFKRPDPDASHDATEKIWDAFERLKTYYTQLDKKASTNQIISDMSNNNQNYIDLFTKEFYELKDIGNNFRIRHHETSKIDIPDPNYYDYFFNRCLSLIGLAIKYLK